MRDGGKEGRREREKEGGCELVTVTEGSRTDFNSLLIDLWAYMMLGLSLPVHHVRLDWLPLPCIALIWTSH